MLSSSNDFTRGKSITRGHEFIYHTRENNTSENYVEKLLVRGGTNEVEKLTLFSGLRGVVQMKAWFIKDTKISIILESAVNNIYDWVEIEYPGSANSIGCNDYYNSVSRKIEDLLMGLHAVHRFNLSHNSIRADNILAFGDSSAKLSSFGCAVTPKDGEEMKKDVIKLGCCICYMLKRRSAVYFPREEFDKYKETCIELVKNPTLKELLKNLFNGNLEGI